MNGLPGISTIWIVSACCTLLLGACSGVPDLQGSYPLINEDNNHVDFPESYLGKTVIVGFVYTNCPDVCLATTASMLAVYERLEHQEDVVFLSITLDPRRDTVATLRKYAEIQGIEYPNWHLLTGSKKTLDSLFAEMGILYRMSFVRQMEDGSEVYFLDHSDVVALIDKHGHVREEFKGTTLDPDEVVEKIDEVS